jgi:hypothetical protein
MSTKEQFERLCGCVIRNPRLFCPTFASIVSRLRCNKRRSSFRFGKLEQVRLAADCRSQPIRCPKSEIDLVPARLGRIGLGLWATFTMVRLISTQLYGVSARDPLSLILVTALLTVISLLALLDGRATRPPRRSRRRSARRLTTNSYM